MNEQLRQSLSAVVDGEADAFELRRVLDELDRDPELRAT
jgi:sigma-E factor negative regulatory protein RseA